MNKEDCSFTSAKNFTNEEKFDIALKYMDYSVRWSLYRMMTSGENSTRHLHNAAALKAMYDVLSNENTFIRCAVELQLAEGSPIWDLDIPF